MAASDYKGAINRKLAQAGISADLDPLWEQWRPACVSDAECAERVFMATLDIQVSEIARKLLAKQIDADTAEALLAVYKQLRGSAADVLVAVTPVATIAPMVSVGVERYGDSDCGEYRRGDCSCPDGGWYG